MTDPEGHVTEFFYDERGNVMRMRDALGTEAFLSHDARGLVTRVTDGRGNSSTFQYDTLGRLTRVTDALDHPVSLTLDAAGNILTLTNEIGHAWTYAFDLMNQWISTTDPLGGVTQFQYDASRNPASFIDPLGHRVQFTHDSRDRLVSADNALGQRVTYAYDPNSNLVTLTDPDGGVWSFGSDALDRRVRSTDPAGASRSFSYDAEGNLLIFQQEDGNPFRFDYDAAGRVIRFTTPDDKFTRYEYDRLDSLTRLDDPERGVWAFQYDALKRLIRATDPLGRVQQWFYDATSNLTRVVYPDSTESRFEYNAVNLLLRAIAPDGGVTTYAYDAHQQLVGLTDPLGRTRQFQYDDINRLIGETDPLGRTESYFYDPASNLNRILRKDGLSIILEYDAANRLIQKTMPAVGSVPPDVVRLSYDERNNILSVSDSDSVISFAYDSVSRVTRALATLGALTRSMDYEYDVVGRRTRMHTAEGPTSYGYDPLNRLVRLTLPSGETFGFDYDALSRLVRQSYPNGAVSDLSYDAASQLTAVNHRSGVGSFASASYAYNDAGNRTLESREDGNRRSLGYDAADRILGATNSAFPHLDESFAYDLVGNWLTEGRIHDADNQLIEDAQFRYLYDPNGNLVRKESKADPDQFTVLFYDAESQLVRVEVHSATGTRVIEYGYDGLGRRIRNTTDGITITYVVDGDNPVIELDAAGNLSASNAHAGLDAWLARRDIGPGATSYIHTDGLGSTIALSDAAGAVVERYRYSTFGSLEVLGPDFSPKAGNRPRVPMTFTGREWDAEAGLYFYRSRYYSPDLGRFLQQDPLGILAGDVNFYAYVGNSPSNLVDPFGLFHQRATTLFGVFFGSLAHPMQYVDDVESGRSGEVVISYAEGLRDGGQGFAKGTYAVVRHPLQTLSALAALTQLSLDDLQCILGAKFETFVNGSPEEQARIIGAIVGEEGAGSLSGTAFAKLADKLKSLAQARKYAAFNASTPPVGPLPRVPVSPKVGGGVLVKYDPEFALRQGGDPKTVVPDRFIVVRGGQTAIPEGTFSASVGPGVTEAASGVPHGTIRATTAGRIRAKGGIVELAPELTRSGSLNTRHVNVTVPRDPPFSLPQPNPIPKPLRVK